jgi:hypothetical protein
MKSALSTSPSPQADPHEVQRLGRSVTDARISDLGNSLMRTGRAACSTQFKRTSVKEDRL